MFGTGTDLKALEDARDVIANFSGGRQAQEMLRQNEAGDED